MEGFVQSIATHTLLCSLIVTAYDAAPGEASTAAFSKGLSGSACMGHLLLHGAVHVAGVEALKKVWVT
jgi:hypothetical protein